MTRVHDALREAAERLTPSVGEAHLLEARILVETALGQSRVWLYQHPEAPLEADQLRRLCHLIERRQAGEPLAYILGTREFYGRSFLVDPRVLVPRQDTETLLERALASARCHPARVVDVGTGSGILGISLALELPWARVVLIDRSADALAVAKENVRRHAVDARLSLVQGDLLTGLDGPADLIVANLPYVPSGEIDRLQPEVRREPRVALDGGPDGLDLYRRLLAQAPSVLGPRGALFAEIGDGQGAAANGLARARFPEYDVRIHPDLEGRDRVLAVTPHCE
ncbi:MAG: peptide chain release factor N(5)-glutamine methyltransferase [Chloroflexota bacterium]